LGDNKAKMPSSNIRSANLVNTWTGSGVFSADIKTIISGSNVRSASLGWVGSGYKSAGLVTTYIPPKSDIESGNLVSPPGSGA